MIPCPCIPSWQYCIRLYMGTCIDRSENLIFIAWVRNWPGEKDWHGLQFFTLQNFELHDEWWMVSWWYDEWSYTWVKWHETISPLFGISPYCPVLQPFCSFISEGKYLYYYLLGATALSSAYRQCIDTRTFSRILNCCKPDGFFLLLCGETCWPTPPQSAFETVWPLLFPQLKLFWPTLSTWVWSTVVKLALWVDKGDDDAWTFCILLVNTFLTPPPYFELELYLF